MKDNQINHGDSTIIKLIYINIYNVDTGYCLITYIGTQVAGRFSGLGPLVL